MRNYQRKKNNPTKILIILTVIIVGLFLFSKKFSKKSEIVNDIVVAEYGDQKIYKSDVEKKINSIFEVTNLNQPSIPFEKMSNSIVEVLAKEIYLDRKISQKASEMGLDKDKKIVDRVEDFKTALIRQTYLENSIKVSDQEILDLYNQEASKINNKVEYRYSQVILKKDQLEKVKKLIAKNTSFNDLINKYSIRKAGLKQDGDIGYVSEKSMLPEMKNAVMSLKLNEISKPVLIGNEYYIFKLTDIFYPKVLSYEDMKDEIKAKITRKKSEEIANQLTSGAKYNLIVKPEQETNANDKINNNTPEKQEATSNENVADSPNPNEAEENKNISDDNKSSNEEQPNQDSTKSSE